MGLTRPRFSQFDTTISSISDPITVLNKSSTLANVDVGFIINRNGGALANTAIFWNEGANTFALAFTTNSGEVPNANVSISTYANLRAGSLTATFVNTTGNIVSGGNVTAPYFFGNGSQLSGVITSVTKIINGTSDVTAYPDSNIAVTVGGTANTVVFTSSNIYVAGSILPTANIIYDLGSPTQRFRTGYFSANTIDIGGGTIGLHDTLGFTFTTPGGNPQYMMPNGASTSNTFTSSTVTIQGNLAVNGNITTISNVSGQYILGSGQFLTGLPASYSNINVKAYTESMGFQNYGNVNVAAYLGGAVTVGGNLTVQGNLIVQGTTTTLNSTTLDVTDLNITVAKGAASAAAANGAGLTVDGAGATLLYTNATDSWNINKAFLSNSYINTTGNIVAASATVGAVEAAGMIYANSTASSTSTTTGALRVAGGIGVVGNVWADRIHATSNGNGTNFRVGDDLWLGDINVANTMRLMGAQDNTQAFIRFGNTNTSTLGVSGSGPLSWGGVLNITGNVLAANVNASYFIGSGTALTGINSFGNVFISGQSPVLADNTSDTLTLVGGTGISITANASSDTITIEAISAAGAFAEAGDFGAVTDPVTVSEDQGSVADGATITYDLGSIISASGLIYPDQLVLPSYATASLPTASVAAQLAFDSDNKSLKYSDGSKWNPVAAQSYAVAMSVALG
jgi:hypothetical protein